MGGNILTYRLAPEVGYISRKGGGRLSNQERPIRRNSKGLLGLIDSVPAGDSSGNVINSAGRSKQECAVESRNFASVIVVRPIFIAYPAVGSDDDLVLRIANDNHRSRLELGTRIRSGDQQDNQAREGFCTRVLEDAATAYWNYTSQSIPCG
jgi:hypothetical protein